MKFVRFLGVVAFVAPVMCFGASSSEFQNAANLLTAARRGDIQTVQILINSGANVNYRDATGLSLVCTAVMNNDRRAIQILQMYGADASNCDKQIKQYQQRTRVAANGEDYSFFSGLSSTHVLALSAAGVAAVIGGVALLTDVFDSDSGNGNVNGSGSSNRPNNNNGSDSSTTTTTKLFALNLPYGPACNGTSCPSDFTVWEDMQDFAYMSDNTTQATFNYLMASHAYNAFVRGYLGMSTIRIASDKSPFDLSSLPYTSVPGGGKPVNVAIVTGSGVNATGSAVDGIITWFDDSNSATSTIASICTANGNDSALCQAALANATKTSHKYFNFSGLTAAEVENTAFDLSGSGSVFGLASNEDTKLAKIVAGWEEGGRSEPDFYGFIPNGQLVAYKTGDGKAWVNTTSSSVTSAYTMAGDSLAENDSFTLADGTVLTVQSVSGNSFVAKDSADNTYNGYLIGTNLYVDSNADGNINQMYVMGSENSLTLTKETAIADYKNYAAIYNAMTLQNSGEYVSNVIANLSLPANAATLSYPTVGEAKILNEEASTTALKKSVYRGLINSYYNLNTSDDTAVNMPGTDANLAFTYLGNYQKQILVNTTGRSLYGLGDGKSLSPQTATFENFAPVVYEDLKNLFASVVALRPIDGTKDVSIDGYTAVGAGKLSLSTWTDANDSETTYISRMCGLSGNGNNGATNPWCFGAPGVSDVDAAASMAGSVALVQSAFNYMTPKQVFLLLALTADGPYLGTNPETNLRWTSNDDLIAYLKNMYVLPIDLDSSSAQYLESFKTAFGYGMINLERATRPDTNVYFYSSDTNTIVSGSNQAYWGAGTTTTSARASSVMSLTGRSAIKTSFFDVLESADGTLSLPRVWNMEIAADSNSKHGLYMGDVLGEFSVDSTNKHSNQVGNFKFDMSASARAYNDNMNGLDDLKISFVSNNYDIDARYQRFLTDGESRFNGRANGVLALVSNSVSSGAKYKSGNFNFGASAFVGNISDENLLENDPVVSSQFEPARLGFANGGAAQIGYNTDSFGFDLSAGNMNETNTVLGTLSDGMISLHGANTYYLDMRARYKIWDGANLTARATFANTNANIGGGIISKVSDIKSNSFALGLDVKGFNFTAAMPLAVVDGKMGYDYADLSVVENAGGYSVVANNPHTEYIDLSALRREVRFSGNYKTSLGEFTDAGVGFIYRINPNNTNAFGNESILMFKIHHRVGI